MARRIALHAFAIGVLAACAGVARADDTVSSEAYLAAAEHGRRDEADANAAKPFDEHPAICAEQIIENRCH